MNTTLQPEDSVPNEYNKTNKNNNEKGEKRRKYVAHHRALGERCVEAHPVEEGLDAQDGAEAGSVAALFREDAHQRAASIGDGGGTSGGGERFAHPTLLEYAVEKTLFFVHRISSRLMIPR